MSVSQADKKSLNGGPINKASAADSSEGEGHGVNVSRKPSKRQQEKAPEGQSPRMSNENEHAVGTSIPGSLPAESKFSEDLS